MSKKTRGSIFTGGTGGVHQRQVDDFYATPSDTTKKILDKLELKGSILEPACGQGHISEILKEYYPNAKVISTDLVDRGYADEIKDFLNDDFEKVDNVITNPPFKYAKEFVIKGLEISNDKVIMLLKIQFLESKSRKEFLENSPLKYIYVFSERQNTMKDGSPINPLNGKPWSSTMLLAWFVWEKGYEGEPIVRWL